MSLKTDFKNFCDIRNGDQNKPIMYFLHGYDSKFARNELKNFANFFNKKGYTTYSCDARGHGIRKNESDINDLIGTVRDYDSLITENKKDSILVGMSIGGIESLKIGTENPYVKSIFAISSPHDDSNFNDPSYIKFLNSTYNNPMKREDMQKILPESKISKNIFLIHDSNDKVVPMDQFMENKDYFGVKEENTLVYNHIVHKSKRSKFFHIYPIKDRRTKKWIEKRL